MLNAGFQYLEQRDSNDTITKDGVVLKEVKGTPEEEAALEKSYKHLCALRDEVIEMGVLPPISEWHALNPNIK